MEVAEVKSITGRGIRANVSGTDVWVGNLRLYSESHLKITASIISQISQLEIHGKTTMLVAIDQQIVGIIAVADVVRSEVKTVLAQLKKMGIRHTIMLTGDNERIASHIAQQASLTDFRSSLLPEDKVTAIRQLVDSYRKVAMVGDGINDAPALANSTTGIAMGGIGTDVALETADAALMADDLSKLPFAIGLGRAARKVILQNLVIAVVVIGGLVVSSVFGLATIGIAIILHEGSTILVVLNSLRLLKYRHRRIS